MARSNVPQGGCYVAKVPTLALLVYGGLTDAELLRLPGVRREDVEAAKQHLKCSLRGEGAC